MSGNIEYLNSPVWTDYEIRIATEMRSLGSSFSTIAARIGRTRHSVIGKLRRLRKERRRRTYSTVKPTGPVTANMDIPNLYGMLAELKASSSMGRYDTAIRIAGTSRETVQSVKRTRDYSAKRWTVFWLLRNLGWSSGKIASATGHDHTSILNACKKIDAELEKLAARQVEGRAA